MDCLHASLVELELAIEITAFVDRVPEAFLREALRLLQLKSETTKALVEQCHTLSHIVRVGRHHFEVLSDLQIFVLSKCELVGIRL